MTAVTRSDNPLSVLPDRAWFMLQTGRSGHLAC